MKKLWLRLGAGIFASLLAVAICAVFVLPDRGGRRSDGLYYAASGIRPDAVLLTVDGAPIRAEEYLYWLAYDCEYLTSYMGEIDWDSALTDEMTYGDYAKADALEMVKMFAVVRRLASENGVTLLPEDEAALAAQKEEFIAYYGDEETYRDQIRVMGVSEEAFDEINAGYYLLNRVTDAFCTEGTSLYPGQEALAAHSRESGLITARLLYLATTELTEEEQEARYALAQSYLDRLNDAPTGQEAFERMGQMMEELGLEDGGGGVTFTESDADPALYAALSEREAYQLTGVVTAENGYYIAMRLPPDLDAAAQDLFSVRFLQLRGDAVVTTTAAYRRLNTGAFYQKLLSLRQSLADELRGEEKNKG